MPPPPADALTMSGYPMPAAAADGRLDVGQRLPGPPRDGIPADSARLRAAILSPICSIDDAGGPTHTSPASVTARANAAFSDRKPYPGCTACAPVDFAAARTASTLR
jgi:hypothetical protein